MGSDGIGSDGIMLAFNTIDRTFDWPFDSTKHSTGHSIKHWTEHSTGRLIEHLTGIRLAISSNIWTKFDSLFNRTFD